MREAKFSRNVVLGINYVTCFDEVPEYWTSLSLDSLPVLPAASTEQHVVSEKWNEC